MENDRKIESPKYIIFKKDTFDRQSAKEIFDELDIHKTGKINIEEFVKQLKYKGNSKTEFQKFFLEIKDDLSGKFEKMLLKLMNIKKKMIKENDKDGQKEMEW